MSYNQIEIHEHDQDKTTFICRVGTLAFKHMSFGLGSVLATFPRCMNVTFLALVGDFLKIFIDNYLVLEPLSI